MRIMTCARLCCIGLSVAFLLATISQESRGQTTPRKTNTQSKSSASKASGSKKVAVAQKKQTAPRKVTQQKTRPPRVNSALSRQRIQHAPVRPAAFGFLSQQRPTSGYASRRQEVVGSQVFQESTEPLVVETPVAHGGNGEIIYDEGHAHHGGCDHCDGGCDTGPTCGTDNACASCCLIPCPRFDWRNIEFLVGVHGTLGPRNWAPRNATSNDRDGSGSFGFQTGINWAMPIPGFEHSGLGMQFGAQGNWSNFSDAEFVAENRNQTFVTAGVFRRVDCGMQAGFVFDYLHDDWYYDMSLTQLRGELSWVYENCNEVGVWITASTNTDRTDSRVLDENGQPFTISESWEGTDLFGFFFRRRFDNCFGSEARLFAGFTGESDGLIGADFRLPFSDAISLETGFTYLVPHESSRSFEEESWALGLNLVWTPNRRRSCCDPCMNTYYRSMFNVANNRSFLVDRTSN